MLDLKTQMLVTDDGNTKPKATQLFQNMTAQIYELASWSSCARLLRCVTVKPEKRLHVALYDLSLIL